MKKIIKLGLPVISAGLTPSVVFFLFACMQDYSKIFAMQLAPVLLLTLSISVAHVILLGLPCVWLLKKLNRFNWWSLSLSGFVLGCFPIGILVSPLFYKSDGFYERGNVSDVGVFPSITWWQEWWMSWWAAEYTLVVQAGAIGAITGLVFWITWSLCNPTVRFKNVILPQHSRHNEPEV